MSVRRAVKLATCAIVLAGCGSDVPLNASGANDQVVIEAHLQPNTACALSTSSPIVSEGTFDLSLDGGSGSGFCNNGYDLNLLVDNRVADTVVFNEADVLLTNADAQTIAFPPVPKRSAVGQQAPAPASPQLPNPLKALFAAPVAAKARGVVTVKVIPTSYAHRLNSPSFSTQLILAQVVLHGQAVSGEHVTSRAFTFPIQLCDGCMTECLSDITKTMRTVDDVYGTACRDNAGADERICIDPGC